MERTRDNTSDSESNANRGTTIVQTLEWLLGLRPEALALVQPLLTDLADVGRLPTKTQRRLVFRVFCVQRYRALRRSADHRRSSQCQVIALVNQDARGIVAAWRCSRRSLQAWIAAWNAIGADGVALGWRGLIAPGKTERRVRYGRSGRRPSQSRQAVAFFDRAYCEGAGGTVAACHRLTLAEAGRQGWDWPSTSAATRYWLAHRTTDKGGRKTPRLNGDRSRVERGSARC